MSNTPYEYPNQLLGVDPANDTNQGAVNSFPKPIKVGTCILWSGAGVPAIGGNVGDLYIRTDGAETTYFYRCTVAGAAGVATWAAMSGA